MKKKFLKYAVTFLLPVSSLSTLVLSSCSNPKPEDDSIKIFEPAIKEQRKEFDSSEAYVNIKFMGFEYQNLPDDFDIEHLSVKNTFQQAGGVPVSSVIRDFDHDTKSFSVELTFFTITEQVGLTGSFSFYIDDILIPESETSNFTVSLYAKQSIFAPSVRYTECDLFEHEGHEDARAIFEGFTWIGNLDPYIAETEGKKLYISSTFRLDETTQFSYSIPEYDLDKKTFSVAVDIQNGFPDRSMVGSFAFKTEDSEEAPIIPFGGENSFNILLNDVKSITTPESNSAECFIDINNNATLLFKGFNFTGFNSYENIKVDNEGFNTAIAAKSPSSNIQYSIVNWNEIAKTFDVQMSIQNIKTFVLPEDEVPLKGQFTFKYNDKDIEVVDQKDFTAQINYAVTSNCLKISNNKLSGIVDGADLTPFNSIYIPENITEISNGAFSGKFTTEQNQNIKYLGFAKGSILNKIMPNAFSGCNGLIQKDLTLPNNINSIGTSAFEGCSGLVGTLTLPKNYTYTEQYAGVKIAGNAFMGCSNLESIILNETINDVIQPAIAGAAFKNCSNVKYIDLSGFTDFELNFPLWLKQSVDIFEGLSSQGTVYLSKLMEPHQNDWITGLQKQKLNITPDQSTSNWKIVYR